MGHLEVPLVCTQRSSRTVLGLQFSGESSDVAGKAHYTQDEVYKWKLGQVQYVVASRQHMSHPVRTYNNNFVSRARWLASHEETNQRMCIVECCCTVRTI